MMIGLVVALNAVCVGAFVSPRSVVARVAPHSGALRATAEDAIGYMEALQAASVNSIAASIPDLAPKADCSWGAADGVTIGGFPATLDARDAAGPANIAWLSSLCVASKVSSLTIFNGPLTDVPHLMSRCAVVDGDKLSFVLDFRPRAYGAYEMRDASGNYPGPDVLGRQAFEYSGARKEYDTKFGNDEVVAFLGSTAASFEGGAPSGVAPTEEDLATRGPLFMSVTMPLTDANVAVVAAARERAASFWLGWALDGQHEHRPGAPVNTQYVYDSKYKINAYGALKSEYTALLGADDGAKLAAADSGPLDEGYVGGGS